MTDEDKAWEDSCGLYPLVRVQQQEQREQHILAVDAPTMRQNRTSPPTPTLPNPSTLNWNNGFARSTLERLVGYETLEKARATNDQNRKTGQSLREMYTALRRFSAGNVIKGTSTFELGQSWIFTFLSLAAKK